ncbi:penicillin-binding protein activator LpoB [Ferruginibacter sp. HRS2-29]|uniref:penicillin-binding protein activator LpoB n=1 Tax=Ferruginibacter sp. HRS2-29 TaxID=2487334 RepID=UPI0020CE15C7|nr:penicillin-binding protein activator LpoB [Ferruginibacter sp. HRS2-29]MCP9752575.1 penicillin-binding protein activator LpoB [Ferruginibacter sp. HRS2-29]
MKSIFLYATAAILLVTTACSRKVTRIDPVDTPDISGKWNNTDSRLTAEELTSQILTEKWIGDYVQAKGKKPVVIVGMVTNKSHEHIEAETFMKDLERSFITSSKIGLVQSGKKREELRAEKADQQTNASVSTMKKFGLENGADFILQGSINSIVDAYKRKKTVTYQVNLELTNIETNEVVWIGEKKIAKNVKN